jgi:purine nucleosidase
MPIPVLLDTDMGIDDAVAAALACVSPEIDLAGLVSVGGNVPLPQATRNMGRLFKAIAPPRWPRLARGLDQQDPGLPRADHVFGRDGFGGIGLEDAPDVAVTDYLDLYEQMLEVHAGRLVIVAVGPLTNLAGVLRQRPKLLEQASRIIIMGGAVWCSGNVTPFAEFNFHLDPEAAAAVLSSGLPVTMVPLDVTRQVGLDESHAAHLSCSGSGCGDVLARMIRYPLEQGDPGERGTFLVHDALAVGVLLWPELFTQARMGIEITLAGKEAGRSKPVVVRDKQRQVGVVISVNAGDFLEKMLGALCDEKFIV